MFTQTVTNIRTCNRLAKLLYFLQSVATFIHRVMVLARVLAVSPDNTSLATMLDILSQRCIIEQM